MLHNPMYGIQLPNINKAVFCIAWRRIRLLNSSVSLASFATLCVRMMEQGFLNSIVHFLYGEKATVIAFFYYIGLLFCGQNLPVSDFVKNKLVSDSFLMLVVRNHKFGINQMLEFSSTARFLTIQHVSVMQGVWTALGLLYFLFYTKVHRKKMCIFHAGAAGFFTCSCKCVSLRKIQAKVLNATSPEFLHF